jgi:AraC-like DNA-binding protein
MQPIPWGGHQELSGSARDHPNLHEQFLSFVARSMHTYRLGKAMPEASSFQTRARSRSVAHFTIVSGVTAGRCQLRRDSADIAGDAQDRYGLYMSLRGEMLMSQFGRSRVVPPGSYALISASEPSIHAMDALNDSICFLVPRDVVDQRVVSGEQVCVRPHVAGAGLHALVFDTVSAFERNAWDISDDDFERSARIVADLVLLALQGSVDLSSGERSIRASNLARAKRIIRGRLSDPDLTLSDVAGECGLSLSYLHELFREKGEGLTMRDYLQGERLQRARELLELSSSRKMSVTEISLECGFSNMSHFSAAFRRAFGLSPRDVMRHRQPRDRTHT